MTDQKNKYQMLLMPKHVSELSAIYDDYLYMVRKYEQLVQTVPIEKLAEFQMSQVYDESNQSDFPFEWRLLDFKEKKEFENLNNDDTPQNLKHSYISLIHTNPEDNKAEALQYAVDGYNVHTMDKYLPSAVERYLIMYPENEVIGKTEFLIDGIYRAKYTKEENAEQPIIEFFDNPKNRLEFRVMVNLINKCVDNRYSEKYQIRRQVLQLYAAEAVEPWEHTILEILGSFAEKMQNICYEIYGKASKKEALECAEKDNLIPSAADFQDYVNIRHLLRHQWDTMDRLGTFHNPSESDKQRAKWIQSYLRLCNKTVIQRQRAYIDVLHQMQQVISRITPGYIVRGQSEGNSKFLARLKELCQNNPDKEWTVEINHSLADGKFMSLQKNIHKFLPEINVKEDSFDMRNELKHWETDYARRSWFLQSYNNLECKIMAYCVTRGEDLRSAMAWNYCRDHHLISNEEYLIWRRYKDFRNALSHNYYSPALRKQLRDEEEPYLEHLNALETKLYNAAPESKRLRSFVYQMEHKDGICVTIDYKNRKFLHSMQRSNQPQLKQQGKIELPPDKRFTKAKTGPTTASEVYLNGVEYTMSANGKIVSFKMPNGATFNFEKQRILWSSDIQFHSNAEHFNVLQTPNCKLMTDKDLRVTEFLEKNRPQKVRGGDTCLLEYKHRAYIDTIGRLKEFSFKKADGQVAKTTFKQTKNGTLISFNDGTCITWRGKDVEVSHNGQILTADTRQEFASSYSGSARIAPQINKSGNGR